MTEAQGRDAPRSDRGIPHVAGGREQIGQNTCTPVILLRKEDEVKPIRRQTTQLYARVPGRTGYVVLGSAAACWSGAYLLFSVVYGPFLLRPSLDE